MRLWQLLGATFFGSAFLGNEVLGARPKINFELNSQLNLKPRQDLEKAYAEMLPLMSNPAILLQEIQTHARTPKIDLLIHQPQFKSRVMEHLSTNKDFLARTLVKLSIDYKIAYHQAHESDPAKLETLFNQYRSITKKELRKFLIAHPIFGKKPADVPHTGEELLTYLYNTAHEYNKLASMTGMFNPKPKEALTPEEAVRKFDL